MVIKFKNYKLLSENENLRLLDIRNLKSVRKNSKNMDCIKIDNHLNWVNNLNNKKNIYYAIEINENIVGGINVIQINVKENFAYWGLFFTDDNLPLISSLVTYLFLDRVFNILNFNELKSEVMTSNINAYKFSLNFGLKVYGEFKSNNIDYYKMHITKDEWNENKYKGYAKMISRRIDRIDSSFIDNTEENKK